MKKSKALFMKVTMIALLTLVPAQSFASNSNTVKMEDGTKYKGNQVEISVDLIEEIQPSPGYNQEYKEEQKEDIKDTPIVEDNYPVIDEEFLDFPVIDWDSIYDNIQNNNTDTPPVSNSSNKPINTKPIKNNNSVEIDSNNGNVSFQENGGWFDDAFVEFKPPSMNDNSLNPQDNYFQNMDFPIFEGNDEFGDMLTDSFYTEEENEIKTQRTIQYVLNLNEKYPFYNDTGMPIADDNLLKYEDAQEILKQISSIKKGKFVEDTDKSLALIDGKIIIIKNEAKLPISNLTTQLKGTSTTVKALDSRMGGHFNLADYIEYKKNITIKVNDKELDITAQPMVENSKVLLPIRDIAGALDAKVIWNDERQEVTIIKDDKTLVFTADSSIAKSNGVKYELSNPTRVENKRMLTLSQFLLNELGGKMEWDAKELTLNIITK